MPESTPVTTPELKEPYTEIGRKLHLLLYTGQLLMENGAHTDRLVRDMTRAAIYMGSPREKFHLHVMYTTLMLNVSDEERSHTCFRKCHHHAVNMSILDAVSHLTWRGVRFGCSLDKYEAALDDIKKTPLCYSSWITTLGAGLQCGASCMLFGGDLIASLFTGGSALLGFFAHGLCRRHGFNPYAAIAIASFIATFCAYLTHFLALSSTPWYQLIACTLFIVPGIPLINAVDDMLNGYIVAGSARAIDTLLIVSSMTFGIVIAIRLGHVADFTSLPIAPDSIYLSHAIAAFIAAIGLGLMFNVPKRLLPVIGTGASIAICLRNICMLQFDMSQAAASCIGAAFLSILALQARHTFDTPVVLLKIPAVIPLIPGVLLYRLLFALLNIHSIDTASLITGIRSGIEAVTIVIAIAVGAALPNLFLHRYIKQSNTIREQRLIKRRHLNE